MTDISDKNISFIRKEFRKILTRYFLLKSFRDLSGILFWFSLTLLSLFLVEYSYRPGSSVRLAMFIFLIGLLFFFVPVTIYRILSNLIRISKYPRTVISEADKKNKALRLLLIYDLLYIRERSVLVGSAIGDVIKQYQKKRSENGPAVFDHKNSKYFRLIVPVLLIVYLFLPVHKDYTPLYRILNYNTDFSSPPSHRLYLADKNLKIAEYDSLKIICYAKGKVPDHINFAKKGSKSASYDTIGIPRTDDSTFVFKTVASDGFSYFFESEETTSDTAAVTVYKRPDISGLKIILSPPEYTGMPVVDYEGLVPNISAYKGSVIKYILNSGKNQADSAYINFENGEKTAMHRSSDGSFEASFTVSRSTDSRFELYKNYKDMTVKNQDQFLNRIDLIEDEYPTVNLIYPKEGYLINKDLQIPLFSTSTDDFGITETLLFMQKVSFNEFRGKEERSDYVKKRISNVEKREGVQVVNTYISASEMNLFPEDRIELFLRVYDNDEVSGPKYTDSKTRTVVLPSIQDLLAESDSNYESQDKMLKEELERNKSVLEKISEITEKLKMNRDMNWEDDKKLRDVIEQQEAMKKNMEELDQNIQQNISMLDKNSLLDEQTIQKYKKLQKLVDDLFTGEMKEKLKELNELKKEDQVSKDRFSEFLENFEEQQDKFKQGIEKSIEILEQIKNEYLIDSLTEQLDDLISKQNEVNDRLLSDNSSKEQNISTEKKIAANYDNFLQDIEKKSKEISYADLSKAVSKAEKEKVRKDISDMIQNMQKSQNENSLDKGNNIVSGLMKMKDAISQIKKDMMEEQKQELLFRIYEVVSDLILISKQTEELKEFSKGLSYASSHAPDIIIRYDRVNRFFENTSEKIFEISKRTFFINKRIIANLGKINKMFSVISGMVNNRRFNSSYHRSNDLMGALNRLTIMLIDAAEEMDRSESPSGLEEMIKKMEEMAKMQSSINSQTSQMQSGKDQTGMSEMQEMMNRLAQEQSQLYDALMKMQKGMGMEGEPTPGEEGQPGPGKDGMRGQGGTPVPGQGNKPGDSGFPGSTQSGSSEKGGSGSVLGDKLGDIASDMKEVEKQLRDKKLDEALTSKQNELMHKLLDAIESVKREKLDNRREGKAGKNRAIDPGKVKIDEFEHLREMLIRSLRDGYTNAYKQKIKQYFKELEN